ncbi:MAG: carbon-nitrogen hydrolase family protein [Bdellovibrionaceae bacterium]|nr:carbon-nitrogen hydrolase family protein [Bdellovibrionales bacterium]MCB9085987.1 carbon-nitrogen hydrolase family protein [Pseudobdellovibrionaceae bacterium]
MAQQPMRVALVQLTSTDCPDSNEAQLFAGLQMAVAQQRVRLIVLPENTLFLRLNRQREIKALELTDSVVGRLQTFCREQSCDLLLTTPTREDGRCVNATLHFSKDGKFRVVYRKIHLFDVDVEGVPPVRESDDFKCGSDGAVLEIEGWKIGLSICYDLRFAELYGQYARQGVDLITVPAAFLVPTGRAHWEVLLRARAIENQAYVLAPAQGGHHQNQQGESRETWGHSLAIGPWGEVIGDLAEAESPSVLCVSLDPQRIQEVRRQIPQGSHRRLN